MIFHRFFSGKSYSMKWNTDLKFTNASFKMTAYYPKDGDFVILEQSLNDVGSFSNALQIYKQYTSIH